MTKQELAQKIKSQYPQYSNIDDNILADKIIEKYPVYLSQITPQKIVNLSTGISKSLQARGADIKETFQKTASGEINPLQTGIRTIGTAVGGAGDVLFQVIKEGVKAISPKAVDVVKGGMAKIGENEIVQTVANKYSDWASRNPEQAKDLEATLNIASIIPIGKAGQVGGKLATQGVQAAERGLTATGRAVGKGLQIAGTAGEKAGKTLVSAAIPPKDIASRVLAYKAKTPLTTRFKQAMEGVEKAPITPSDVVIKYNLPTVTRSGIGIKAKRLADDLFNNQVKPTLSGIKERVSKKEVFDGIQRKINEVKDISRRKSLQNAFEALSDDYAKVSSWGVKTLDEIKSSMATRLPSKVWKGQDIAGDMNNVRKMFSDEARNIVRSKLPAQVVSIYDDYGALKEVMKIGEKAIQAGVNTNMIGLTGEVWRSGATPLLTGVGTGVSKVGTALRKAGIKLKNSETKLRAGLSIEDVSPKAKGEILKSTPLKSNLINEAKKYKTAEEFIKVQGTPVYRGDATPIKLSEMDTTKVFNPAEKEALSAFNNTPGLYFTDSVANAQSYGKNLTEVSVKPTANIINVSDAPKILKRADVEKIIRSNPRIEDWAMNWDENFDKAIKQITDSVMAEKDGNEFLKAIWSDGGFSDGDFVKAMQNVGIDGLKVPKEGVNHFVIYNKDTLQTKSQLIDIWNKAHK